MQGTERRAPMDDEGRPITIKVECFPLPIQGRVRGLTVKRAEGFTVLIDRSRSQEEQAHTLGHELAHIYLHHFDRGGHWRQIGDGGEFLQAEELEREADERAAEFYRLFLNGKLSEHSAARF